MPPQKRSFHGRFQHKVVPFFHCLCLVFLSSGDLSLPSCMPMPLSSAQLSFVFTSPYHSCPFCLHCLGSSSKIFWSSPDPKSTHRGATGSPVLPLPSPTLSLSLPDVSLLLSQRGFCLTFFQEKKVDRTFLAIEGTPPLLPSHSWSWCAMALRHPPPPFFVSHNIETLFFLFLSWFVAGI